MADPEFFMLKPSAWMDASTADTLLGSFVQNYADPLSGAHIPAIGESHLQYSVGEITGSFTDFITDPYAERTKDPSVILNSLGFKSTGETDEAFGLQGKLIWYRRLKDVDYFFDKVRNDSAVRSRVSKWISPWHNAFLVVGIMICEDVDIIWTTDTTVSQSNAEVPIRQITRATGELLSATDAHAESTTEITGHLRRARSGQSKIFAIQLRPVTKGYNIKQLSVIDRHRVLGSEREEDDSIPDDELFLDTFNTVDANARTYYYGLKAILRLLSSTLTTADASRQPPRDPTDSGFVSKKRLFTIERNHPIVPIWESHIFRYFKDTYSSEHVRSVNCLRIGVGSTPMHNPVTILVLVEPNKVSAVEAESTAKRTQDLCKSHSLSDVEVEIAELMEPRNAGDRMRGHDDTHVLNGPFARNLYIGASIGPPWSSGWGSSGSFGGHIIGKGKSPPHKEMLLALTCDHVCFTDHRPCHEKALVQRVYKMNDSTHRYEMLTPSASDADDTEEFLRQRVDAASINITDARKRGDQDFIRQQEEARVDADRSLQGFLSAKRKVGDIFGTGGARVSANAVMPMDWGVVLEDLELEHQDLNKLPPIQFSGGNTIISAIERAMGCFLSPQLGNPTPATKLPPGTLPRQISRLRTISPNPDEVFFKVGRTTGWTAGRYNPCRSMVLNNEYSDYGWCLFWCFLGIPSDVPFGAPGDSGSLVFDREGQATGLYFAGRNSIPDVSCVISLDTVFRDIETQLDVTDIRLAS
ncbi:hypothetical protein PCL_09511 [Purpureocillium lilacinum]|uniref:Uncharacterized protein n=1 Tax=Purpureocillium lilacinum TaxID=33203 RepID=A0A2U3DQQ8_PURLI|nr:hypothetical protein PCL_09511 [Purpureocillium lilacinum]